MRILAFDISASPGVAVLEIKRGRPLLVYADSIKTDTSTPDSQRFAYVEAFAIKAIHERGPFDVVVREHFTKGGSKRSTQLVFGSWAMIDAALGKYGYKVDAEITPTTVKKIVGGNGSASKEEVEAGVRRILGLADDYVFKSNDESDAAAIGLAYLIREGLIET
ncbi:crossover junction endodeoxyribonuclease RuvC [Bacillus sp. 03113]|uniref:crossover junction endodeoxyribonuclease RuvC n=1 Tax=Bacillus sp. 03113 TaxID=2578211 RepID=UPI0011439E98|nr:crossover junction endodeoxyribonuclease RuvC [Bacillus sp. 03113]